MKTYKIMWINPQYAYYQFNYYVARYGCKATNVEEALKKFLEGFVEHTYCPELIEVLEKKIRDCDYAETFMESTDTTVLLFSGVTL